MLSLARTSVFIYVYSLSLLCEEMTSLQNKIERNVMMITIISGTRMTELLDRVRIIQAHRHRQHNRA